MGAFFLVQIFLDREFIGEAVINAAMWQHRRLHAKAGDDFGIPVRVPHTFADEDGMPQKEVFFTEPHKKLLREKNYKNKHVLENTKAGNGTNVDYSKYVTECRLPRVFMIF
jgi:hypothetical protein